MPDETQRNPLGFRGEAPYLERLWADQDAGQLLPLSEYVRLFPDVGAPLVREYHVLNPTPGGTEHDERLPTYFGPYRVLEELGHGGQGTVFLAQDTRLGRNVALKVLTGWQSVSPESLARFVREAALASKLDHPGICAVYDTGIERDVHYIVMRYVEGESLGRKIARAKEAPLGPAPSGQESSEIMTSGAPTTRALVYAVVRLIETTARALHEAHRVGIIHRDVKPQNIMVTPTGEPVLLDFGLARDLDAGAIHLTGVGQMVGGTVPYMSPEQISSHVLAVDERSDVWSLGVTLYECLTLERPFDRPTQSATFEAIQTAPCPSAQRANASIPRELDVVVRTALEKSRKDRYASALDFAEDLRRVREQKPIRARPMGPLLRLLRWGQRAPGTAALVAAVFSVLMGSIAVITRQNARLDAALAKTETRSTEARTYLEEFWRLADSLKLQELQDSEEHLYPAVAAVVPAMEIWLHDARNLVDRLAGHRDALRDLRNRRAQASGKESGDVERWKIEQFARLVERLETFSGADSATGIVARVEQRWDLARARLSRTVTTQSVAWQSAVERVEQDLGYRGVQGFKPIEGLIPLGTDPHSGLQEFALDGTGSIPDRDEKGHLALAPDMAVVFVLIPGKRLHVGATSESGKANFDPWAGVDDGPVVIREVSPFLISKFELTQGQWQAMDPKGQNPSFLHPLEERFSAKRVTLRHPVENVSFSEAVAGLRRFGLRLPSEAEWERACRGETQGPWHGAEGPGGLAALANLAGEELGAQARQRGHRDDFPFHAPVGSFDPNSLGLHDMHGNVAEWVDPPTVPLTKDAAVVRGGSYYDSALSARSGNRELTGRTSPLSQVGVRAALDLTGLRIQP